MEWNEDIDMSKRKMTSQLIVQRAVARGWKVCAFKTSLAIFQLYIPGRDKPVRIFSASPPQMSYVSAKIAKDKFITNCLLKEAGQFVPAEMLVSLKDEDQSAAIQFIRQHGSAVLKPLDASHGKGITVNITDEESYVQALDEAQLHTEKSTLVLQEQLSGVDVRIVCIDYKFVDAISRLPASVKGDGKHTVRQLIEITNLSDERGMNYVARLNMIPLDRVEAYLGVEAMERVPQNGEEVQVIGVSNVGMGGVRRNLGQRIPKELRLLAEQAARTLDLPLCGVDFMVKHEPTAEDTIESLSPKIIEVNECPMLTMYEDLQSPEQSAVIDRYLDYVAKY